MLLAEPLSTLEWAVGDPISFEGEAWDEEDGVVPTTSLDWSTRLFHCPSGCHAHPLQAFPAVASGSFPAPDHEYPSYIEVRLTAIDARGLAATKAVAIYPRAVQLSVTSSPPGLTLSAGPETGPTPLSPIAIKEGSVSLVAPATQQLGGRTYGFERWSDGGERAHTVVAEGPAAYEAIYSAPDLPAGPGPAGSPASSAAKPSPPAAGPVPRTVLNGHPRKRGAGAAARFTFSSKPAGAGFRCKLDRRPFRPCRSPRSYAGLSGGPAPLPGLRRRPGLRCRPDAGRVQVAGSALAGAVALRARRGGLAPLYSARTSVCQAGSSGMSYQPMISARAVSISSENQ